MRTNVGILDRAVRVVVGLGLVSLVFVGPHTPFGWLGVVPLASALGGYCPLYTLVGLNTAKTREK